MGPPGNKYWDGVKGTKGLLESQFMWKEKEKDQPWVEGQLDRDSYLVYPLPPEQEAPEPVLPVRGIPRSGKVGMFLYHSLFSHWLGAAARTTFQLLLLYSFSQTT